MDTFAGLGDTSMCLLMPVGGRAYTPPRHSQSKQLEDRSQASIAL